MTCQYFSAVCLLCSLVIIIMTTSVRSRSFCNESHAIPPVISEGPSYHVYFKPEGNGITLPCVATGTPPITYNWRKNGAPLEFNDRVQMGGGSGSLLMFRPTIASEGYYQCIASSAAGAAMSNITFVQAAVLESSQDHRSRMSVKPLTAEDADHLKFPCSHIAKSIPAPEFVWEKEDFPLSKSDNRITQTTDGWIVFAYVQPSDSGNYKCAPYNGILRESLGGSRFRLSVEVGDGSVMERKVHEAPVLIYSSPNATIVEGENLSLTCLFGSWPPGYQVEWTLPSGTMGPSGSPFVIKNASLEDEGVYNCRAFKTTTLGSKLYSQTGEISVQIDAIPSFTIFPTNQEVVRGQRANFSCQGQGRPTPNVTWYANGISVKQIKDTDSYRPTTSSDGITEFLYLNDIQTTATVTCNISNLHGYRLHTAKIVFASETDVDITNPSSQTRSVQPSKEASTELSSTPTKTSTEPSHKVITYSKQTLSLKENAVSKIGGPGNSDAHVSNSATSIIQTSVGVVGGLVVVVFIIIVVVVVCIRRRNRSTEDQVVPQDYRLRNDFLIVNNERVAYDSDDSGLGVDDQRTENIERRNLQQP